MNYEGERKRVDWSQYVPLTTYEAQLLSYLAEHFDSAKFWMSNDFQRQFIGDMVSRYQEAQDGGEEFYFSHKQRWTFWSTLIPHAHQCLPPEMFPVFEQVSAIVAACNARRGNGANE